jgi:diguanylate cyclase (GGDEF)-like protein
LVFGFDTSSIYHFKIAWWVSVVCFAVFRFADYFYWQINLKNTDYNPLWPYRRFVFGTLGTAVLWCAYEFLISHNVEVIELAFTLIVIAAMAGGAASVLAASKFAAIAYCIILLFPGSIYLMSTSVGFVAVLGMLGAGFCLVMVFTANKSSNSILKAISLKFYNMSLIDELQTEKLEIKRMNSELNKAYQKLNQINSSLEQQVESRTKEVYKLSKLDPLTKLYNRTAFLAAVDELVQSDLPKPENLAVLFIDLDRFKKINDIFGHEVGDQVLVIVTRRLLNFKVKGNLARWGGDEFVLAIKDLSKSQAEELAHNIIKAIEEEIQVGSLNLSIGASIGIALSPEHSREIKQLIQYADIAMFQQKVNPQSSSVVFSDKLLSSVKFTERLRDGLRTAVENQELHLVYQPIIDCAINRITSCEALLRWTFEGQPIGPDRFIPVAEQSSSILQIGEWVLRKSCMDAQAWPKKLGLSVSVNVSMVQLVDESFLKILDHVLSESELAPNRLILEITESVFAENKQTVSNIVQQIMSRNVRVSIDDFGTGYSSLSQLQSLPFHILKIDRSFVSQLDEKGAAIVRAALYIAQELGCETVAEGIETSEQANTLKTLGASFFQGYLFSKPLVVEELVEFIEGYTNTLGVE